MNIEGQGGLTGECAPAVDGQYGRDEAQLEDSGDYVKHHCCEHEVYAARTAVYRL